MVRTGCIDPFRVMDGGVVMLRRGPPRPCQGGTLGCFAECGRRGNHVSLHAYASMAGARSAQARASGEERILLLHARGLAQALPRLPRSARRGETVAQRGLVLVHVFHGARFGEVDALAGGYRGRGVVEAGLLETVDASCVAWIGIVEDMQALADLHPQLRATESALGVPVELLLLQPCADSRLRWIGVR